MRFLRTTSAALMSLLLALVLDGTFLMACPALFGGAESCDHCSRPAKGHCPVAPGDQVCPLLTSDRLAGEAVAVASATVPVFVDYPRMAAIERAPAGSLADWDAAERLHLRLHVLRI